MLSSLAPARRRLLLGVLAAVLAGILVAVTLVVTRDGAGLAAPAVAQDRPGPVLLVPGYGGSTTALESLAGRLRAAGREATVVRLPGNGTGDLPGQAAVLAAAARTALAGGASSVDVVGYSAGGVVARLWAAEEGGAAVARRIVTLGSPHHGTRVAALGASLFPGQCPAACRQLVPDSDLLRDLNGDETPDGPQWVSLWTTRDQVVTPPETARLDGALNVAVQSVCGDDPGLGHAELPTDPAVQSLVLAALAPAVPTALTATHCA
ncbi:MAG: lipase, class 2 [uncultured Corynebacteriales bacterium]|uniref:Lipase, class 2 n=1 Tax=uncultured Mycobacteriales bacterium TaxID=581187 RepID=A0A6J4J579_9ACTN|nr:MAG: lipase, class 2 [uncultured Corynebacteriales bacterium]